MEKALLASKNHDWRTPENVLKVVRQIAKIGLDPCTTHDNPVGAETIICPPDDGLLYDWKRKDAITYVNPPYGRELPAWVSKSVAEARCGAEIVLLTPALPGTAWFRSLWHEAAVICFWNNRIKFRGAKSTSPFPSMLSYFGKNAMPAASIWAHHGCIKTNIFHEERCRAQPDQGQAINGDAWTIPMGFADRE